ncbi:hypothetical protein ACFL2Y_03195 [Candidatus Omnitrophota bacterium]
MRKVSFEALITKSINRTKLILFRPFSLKKWLCLLLIAWLAGALGGGSGNFNLPGGDRDSKEAEAAEQEYQFGSFDEQITEGESVREIEEDWNDDTKLTPNNNICPLSSGKAFGAIGIIALGIIALFIIPLIILFSWISARFQFIWFNSIVANDASIEEPFKRYKKEGNSLFKFFLAMTFVVIGLFGLLALWVYLSGMSAGGFEGLANLPFMQVLGIFALPALTFIVGIILLAVISVCVNHFVVTIMAMERCSFITAWKRTMGIINHNKKDFFLYLLVLMGLGIVTGILAIIIVLICIIVILIIAAIILGLPYLLIVSLLKANWLYIIFAIIVGIPLFVVTILLLVSINLPFAVFFRSFSLYFVSSLDCGYAPLLLDDMG